jgi:excisionase family DNA binding protein
MDAGTTDLHSTFFKPLVAPDGERPRVEALHDHLERHFEAVSKATSSPPTVRLEVGAEHLVVPAFLAAMIRDLLGALARGDMVTLIPSHRELTTQEAADLLNVSRQYVIQLLERGEIPYARVNKHRRIRADDLLAFKEARDRKRREGLRRMTQEAQGMGNYFGKK